MEFDLIKAGSALRVVSTVAAGLFAGGCLYITTVESPGRMTHDPTSAITMWKPSFIRAAARQSQMNLISVSSSFAAFVCLRKQTPDAWKWLGAGAAMLSVIPFTLIFISPLNSQLMETEKCISVKGDKWITENLQQWHKMHTARTFISIGAFSFMAYTLFTS